MLGFSRLNNHIGENLLPTEPIDESGSGSKTKTYMTATEKLWIKLEKNTHYICRDVV